MSWSLGAEISAGVPATLHLGFDHERLTYRLQGRNDRLTCEGILPGCRR